MFLGARNEKISVYVSAVCRSRLFSCFLAKIGGELPLDMTAANYRLVFLNPLALPYILMELGFGILMTLLLNTLLRKFVFVAE
ncbi:hypothetical protein [Shewanella sp.]|uniref:hypothetical protein n=1 Tax=Shewanella sp. TaxID=50422 RepID=UPI003A982A03